MLNLNGRTKVALIGSAPSSIHLAPYDDNSWFIMGCSPGAYGPCRRSDAWFENHRWEPQIPGKMGSGKPWYSPEYCEFLIRHPGDIWMASPVPPEIPHAKPIPVDFLVEKYGPFFMTSSLSWMMALALETPGVEEIGLWGVDMSATEEYGYQRAGCQYFITLAKQSGIKVTVPPESDLLQPAFWYGVTENHPMMIKLTARREELQQRKAAADQRATVARDESIFLSGAIDDISYMINTWVTHQAWIQPTLGKTGNETRHKSNGFDYHPPLETPAHGSPSSP